MAKNTTGVYQLKNGNWAYRFGVLIDGKTVWKKKTRTFDNKPITTKSIAIRERNLALSQAKYHLEIEEDEHKKKRFTFADVYNIYSKEGHTEKAYTTKLKQDSLWNNHISKRFGNRELSSVSLAEINDYLSSLYYEKEYSYQYVGSFLKMFYLIYGQAYARNLINAETYKKMCQDKSCKIHMPRIKTNDEDDVVIYSSEQLNILDNYFKGTNAETAYLLGKYCGLRINECYGLRWANVNLEKGTILIDRQMQYQEGLIKLVPVKTRNAHREIIMCDKLQSYLLEKKQSMQFSPSQMAIRNQNQTYIEDINGEQLSSLALVNCLDNGKIQTNNSMKFHSSKIAKEYDFIFRYHYLRHTYGSMLAGKNAPAYMLCKQLGHSSINVTMKYYINISEDAFNDYKNIVNTF